MAEREAVLIVGGSAGIGLAIATEFACRGYDVILIARDIARLTAAAEQLTAAHGIRATTLAMDATLTDAPARLIDALNASKQRVLYAVIGIGVWRAGSAASLTAADLRHILECNVTAPHALAQALLPRLAPTGGLLVVGSLAGCIALPWLSAYAASKSCLHAQTLALRMELATTGPGVTVLAPGIVRTDFLPRTGDTRWQWLIDLVGSSPQTVARAAYLGLRSNQAMVVPGLLWRSLWLGMRLLPAPIVRRLTRRLLTPVAAAMAQRVAGDVVP